MQRHEEFESLCALALIGDLTAEERLGLQEHMRGCESCCRSAQQFVDVLHHMPIDEVDANSPPVQPLEESVRTQHFLSRARREGIVFSRDALEQEIGKQRKRPFSLPFASIAPAFAAVLVLGVGLALLARWPAHPAPIISPNTALPKPVIIENTAPSQAALESQLQTAETALREERHRVVDLNSKLEESERDRLAVLAEGRVRAQMLNELRTKSTASEQQVAKLSAEAQKNAADRDQAVASLIASESRTHEVESQLGSVRAAVEQERELNAVARDVRELMGARKLHVIDVYDSDNHSQTDRSFGRVIYTEGKSLIFYAFDLDRAHNVKKVSFQAWGEREGEHRTPKKLGVFYIDDAAQKRWVLKVNDPEKLKAIDTVFVTVETHPNVTEPSHQRLLQAYLGSTANHP